MRTVTPNSKAQVRVDLPPSVNNLFATVGRRRVKTKKYKTWLANAVAALVELRNPKEFPVGVVVHVVGKVNAARDLDNLLKPIADAMVAAGVLPDDSLGYVGQWRIRYMPDDLDPSVDVHVSFEALLSGGR